jgi:hypothetical protein
MNSSTSTSAPRAENAPWNAGSDACGAAAHRCCSTSASRWNAARSARAVPWRASTLTATAVPGACCGVAFHTCENAPSPTTLWSSNARSPSRTTEPGASAPDASEWSCRARLGNKGGGEEDGNSAEIGDSVSGSSSTNVRRGEPVSGSSRRRPP